MEYPQTTNYEGREYKLVKIYDNFGLYEDIKTKSKTCLNFYDLGLIKNEKKQTRSAFHKISVNWWRFL